MIINKECKEVRVNPWLLGILTTLVCGLFISATAWNFSATAAMPEKYVTKERVDRITQSLDRRLDKLDAKMDKLIDHLINKAEDDEEED